MKNFTKAQWDIAFDTILIKPIGEILHNHQADIGMMQHIYSSDQFLETLTWIEDYFGYDKKNEITKGVVFILGVAVLSQVYINQLNLEEA